MSGATPKKKIIFLTLSMGSDCRISVLIFLNVIIPFFPIWTISYWKFTFNTLSLTLVYSLQVNLSEISYSFFLFSNFLISLDTFLQVSFKNAILLVDAVILSVYEKYFLMIFFVDSLFSNISFLIL